MIKSTTEGGITIEAGVDRVFTIVYVVVALVDTPSSFEWVMVVLEKN